MVGMLVDTKYHLARAEVLYGNGLCPRLARLYADGNRRIASYLIALREAADKRSFTRLNAARNIRTTCTVKVPKEDGGEKNRWCRAVVDFPSNKTRICGTIGEEIKKKKKKQKQKAESAEPQPALSRAQKMVTVIGFFYVPSWAFDDLLSDLKT